jgi:addiction module HigA family antidote
MNEDKLRPIHPGEVLLEEFLKPMNLSQNQMALALRVPARRIVIAQLGSIDKTGKPYKVTVC